MGGDLNHRLRRRQGPTVGYLGRRVGGRRERCRVDPPAHQVGRERCPVDPPAHQVAVQQEHVPPRGPRGTPGGGPAGTLPRGPSGTPGGGPAGTLPRGPSGTPGGGPAGTLPAAGPARRSTSGGGPAGTLPGGSPDTSGGGPAGTLPGGPPGTPARRPAGTSPPFEPDESAEVIALNGVVGEPAACVAGARSCELGAGWSPASRGGLSGREGAAVTGGLAVGTAAGNSTARLTPTAVTDPTKLSATAITEVGRRRERTVAIRR